MSVNCPAQLRALYHDGRVIPFIGAGVSAGVEWTASDGQKRAGPSWEQLVDQAARLIGFDDPNLLRVRGTDLQVLEYFRLKRHNEVGELVLRLNQEMNPSDAELEAALVLAELASLERCQTVYTTNYDNFLERAFQLHGRASTRIALEGHIADSLKARMTQTYSGQAPPCEIVKFHGDFESFDRMVLSDADYERRLALQDLMDHRLRSDMLGRAVLFLGYSFRDWNVSYLFRLVNQAFGDLPDFGPGRRAYITVADPSDFEYTLFRARNIEVIPISSRTRGEDLVELLRELKEPVSV